MAVRHIRNTNRACNTREDMGRVIGKDGLEDRVDVVEMHPLSATRC
jgi:predicted RNA-binding protein YlqC (UPF0109 family)